MLEMKVKKTKTFLKKQLGTYGFEKDDNLINHKKYIYV